MMTAQQLKESSVQHSSIVGGSTAKRVISCPGSVKLVQKMPPQPSNKYADEGSMLHEAISTILSEGTVRAGMFKHKDQLLTQELYDEKIVPAMDALDEIDPDGELVYKVETRVEFGDLLPGVFGSTDLIGRLHDRAIILDWKFGSGVPVAAEENAQLLFYAAAAMRTESAKWAFEGVTEVECIIVQPPAIRRWKTTVTRVKQFEHELMMAVKTALRDDAPLAQGDHCRWCAAKPICPQMTGAVDRALKQQLVNLDVDTLGKYLKNADLLEDWIKDLRALAFGMLEKNVPVPGYKLVQKQARRKWTDDSKAKEALLSLGLKESVVVETSIMSPAQAEKALKKRFSELPEELIKSESSGTTLAPEDDPRPAVQSFIGLSKALSKL
jgi:hypothetical protein